MKGLSTLLSFLLAAPAFAQSPPGSYDQTGSTATAYTHPPVTVLAKRPPERDDDTTRRLKTARGIGGATALSGLGLLGYVIASGATGPLGFAVGLICLGALSAYEAHKGLESKKHFQRSGETAP